MSDRKKIPATVTKAGNGDFVETHPSFAMVSLSRWSSGGGRSFFGSAIEPHAGVSLSIQTGEKHRSLSNHWYHATGELIEINMTEAQFAQLITSFNIGGGVPATLSHVNKRNIAELPDGIIPECPEVSERKLVDTEFKEDMTELMHEVDKLVAKAEAFQEKPSINKADRKEFAAIADHISHIVKSGIPFVQKQFNEALDTTVSHAKADVDAFVTNLMRQAGVEALADKVRSLKVRLLPEDTATDVQALPVPRTPDEG
jgi:hypothetical protein